MEEKVRSNSEGGESSAQQDNDNGEQSDYDAAENLEEEEQMEMDEDNDSLEQEREIERVAAEYAEQEREIERVAEEYAEQEREIERMAEAEAAEEAWIERQVDAAAEQVDAAAEQVDAAAERTQQQVDAAAERTQQRIANAEQAQELDRVDYDIAIPSQHSYLDMALTRVEGYNYWLEGHHVNLYIIPLDVIVIPGQSLPLRIRQSTLQFAMVRALLDTNQKTFGAVYLPAERETLVLDRSWSQIGVTVQIVEVSDETPNEIVLKCKGRQRFKTISTQRRTPILHAKVKILADHIPDRLYDPLGKLRDSFKLSSHPTWLYKSHDVYTIVGVIKEEIARYSPLIKVNVAPVQPDMFSYWLISAMPFKFNQRAEMLRENNLVVRLKSQLDHIKELNQFDYCCQLCGKDIINSSRLVSMSADGSFFVNPQGFAFELITAYSVQHAIADGVPTTQDSWFPGYAWSYLKCLRCDSFLGWKFTAVVEETQPRIFYGIQRKVVRVLRHSEVEPEPEEDITDINFGRDRIIYDADGNYPRYI
ncbi:protein cereblon-like isoform X2 [Bolinopsis microptera]|uniref:protein cereblon-like isoform X2 n=1 Tax=Bolinopsis microptera TaxID=2820187 RepID=UPI003079B7F2